MPFKAAILNVRRCAKISVVSSDCDYEEYAPANLSVPERAALSRYWNRPRLAGTVGFTKEIRLMNPC
eukprot:3178145-Pleurochrysis_carterae.AAC.1